MLRRTASLALAGALAAGLTLAGCVSGGHHHSGGGGYENENENVTNNSDPRNNNTPPPPPPRNDPPPPPPPQNNGPVDGIENHHDLPYMGSFEAQVHPGEIWLKRGYYTVGHSGTFKFEGPGVIMHGQGQESTVIKGNVEVHGNGYIFTNLMIDGDLEIHGNDCNFQNVDVKGKYHDKGHNNRHW